MCRNYDVLKCYKPVVVLLPSFYHLVRWKYLGTTIIVSEVQIFRKKRKLLKKFKDTIEHVHLQPYYHPILCSVNVEVQPADLRHEIITKKNDLVKALTAQDMAEIDGSTSTFYYAFIHSHGIIYAVSTDYTDVEFYIFSSDSTSKIVYIKIAAASLQRTVRGSITVDKVEEDALPSGSWETEERIEMSTLSVVRYLELERYYKEQGSIDFRPRISFENRGLFGLERHDIVSSTSSMTVLDNVTRTFLVINHRTQFSVFLIPYMYKHVLLIRLSIRNPRTSTLVMVGHSHFLITDLFGFTFSEFSNRLLVRQEAYKRVEMEKKCRGSKLKMVPFSYFIETRHKNSFLDHDPSCETIYTSHIVPNTFYPYSWSQMSVLKPPGPVLYVIRVHFMRVPTVVTLDEPKDIEISASFEERKEPLITYYGEVTQRAFLKFDLGFYRLLIGPKATGLLLPHYLPKSTQYSYSNKKMVLVRSFSVLNQKIRHRVLYLVVKIQRLPISVSFIEISVEDPTITVITESRHLHHLINSTKHNLSVERILLKRFRRVPERVLVEQFRHCSGALLMQVPYAYLQGHEHSSKCSVLYSSKNLANPPSYPVSHVNIAEYRRHMTGYQLYNMPLLVVSFLLQRRTRYPPASVIYPKVHRFTYTSVVWLDENIQVIYLGQEQLKSCVVKSIAGQQIRHNSYATIQRRQTQNTGSYIEPLAKRGAHLNSKDERSAHEHHLHNFLHLLSSRKRQRITSEILSEGIKECRVSQVIEVRRAVMPRSVLSLSPRVLYSSKFVRRSLLPFRLLYFVVNQCVADSYYTVFILKPIELGSVTNTWNNPHLVSFISSVRVHSSLITFRRHLIPSPSLKGVFALEKHMAAVVNISKLNINRLTVVKNGFLRNVIVDNYRTAVCIFQPWAPTSQTGSLDVHKLEARSFFTSNPRSVSFIEAKEPKMLVHLLNVQQIVPKIREHFLLFDRQKLLLNSFHMRHDISSIAKSGQDLIKHSNPQQVAISVLKPNTHMVAFLHIRKHKVITRTSEVITDGIGKRLNHRVRSIPAVPTPYQQSIEDEDKTTHGSLKVSYCSGNLVKIWDPKSKSIKPQNKIPEVLPPCSVVRFSIPIPKEQVNNDIMSGTINKPASHKTVILMKRKSDQPSSIFFVPYKIKELQARTKNILGHSMKKFSSHLVSKTMSVHKASLQRYLYKRRSVHVETVLRKAVKLMTTIHESSFQAEPHSHLDDKNIRYSSLVLQTRKRLDTEDLVVPRKKISLKGRMEVSQGHHFDTGLSESSLSVSSAGVMKSVMSLNGQEAVFLLRRQRPQLHRITLKMDLSQAITDLSVKEMSMKNKVSSIEVRMWYDSVVCSNCKFCGPKVLKDKITGKNFQISKVTAYNFCPGVTAEERLQKRQVMMMKNGKYCIHGLHGPYYWIMPFPNFFIVWGFDVFQNTPDFITFFNFYNQYIYSFTDPDPDFYLKYFINKLYPRPHSPPYKNLMFDYRYPITFWLCCSSNNLRIRFDMTVGISITSTYITSYTMRTFGARLPSTVRFSLGYIGFYPRMYDENVRFVVRPVPKLSLYTRNMRGIRFFEFSTNLMPKIQSLIVTMKIEMMPLGSRIFFVRLVMPYFPRRVMVQGPYNIRRFFRTFMYSTIYQLSQGSLVLRRDTSIFIKEQAAPVVTSIATYQNLLMIIPSRSSLYYLPGHKTAATAFFRRTQQINVIFSQQNNDIVKLWEIITGPHSTKLFTMRFDYKIQFDTGITRGISRRETRQAFIGKLTYMRPRRSLRALLQPFMTTNSKSELLHIISFTKFMIFSQNGMKTYVYHRSVDVLTVISVSKNKGRHSFDTITMTQNQNYKDYYIENIINETSMTRYKKTLHQNKILQVVTFELYKPQVVQQDRTFDEVHLKMLSTISVVKWGEGDSLLTERDSVRFELDFQILKQHGMWRYHWHRQRHLIRSYKWEHKMVVKELISFKAKGRIIGKVSRSSKGVGRILHTLRLSDARYTATHKAQNVAILLSQSMVLDVVFLKGKVHMVNTDVKHEARHSKRYTSFAINKRHVFFAQTISAASSLQKRTYILDRHFTVIRMLITKQVERIQVKNFGDKIKHIHDRYKSVVKVRVDQITHFILTSVEKRLIKSLHLIEGAHSLIQENNQSIVKVFVSNSRSLAISNHQQTFWTKQAAERELIFRFTSHTAAAEYRLWGHNSFKWYNKLLIAILRHTVRQIASGEVHEASQVWLWTQRVVEEGHKLMSFKSAHNDLMHGIFYRKSILRKAQTSFVKEWRKHEHIEKYVHHSRRYAVFYHINHLKESHLKLLMGMVLTNLYEKTMIFITEYERIQFSLDRVIEKRHVFAFVLGRSTFKSSFHYNALSSKIANGQTRWVSKAGYHLAITSASTGTKSLSVLADGKESHKIAERIKIYTIRLHRDCFGEFLVAEAEKKIIRTHHSWGNRHMISVSTEHNVNFVLYSFDKVKGQSHANRVSRSVQHQYVAIKTYTHVSLQYFFRYYIGNLKDNHLKLISSRVWVNSYDFTTILVKELQEVQFNQGAIYQAKHKMIYTMANINENESRESHALILKDVKQQIHWSKVGEVQATLTNTVRKTLIANPTILQVTCNRPAKIVTFAAFIKIAYYEGLVFLTEDVKIVLHTYHKTPSQHYLTLHTGEKNHAAAVQVYRKQYGLHPIRHGVTIKKNVQSLLTITYHTSRTEVCSHWRHLHEINLKFIYSWMKETLFMESFVNFKQLEIIRVLQSQNIQDVHIFRHVIRRITKSSSGRMKALQQRLQKSLVSASILKRSQSNVVQNTKTTKSLKEISFTKSSDKYALKYKYCELHVNRYFRTSFVKYHKQITFKTYHKEELGHVQRTLHIGAKSVIAFRLNTISAFLRGDVEGVIKPNLHSEIDLHVVDDTKAMDVVSRLCGSSYVLMKFVRIKIIRTNLMEETEYSLIKREVRTFNTGTLISRSSTINLIHHLLKKDLAKRELSIQNEFTSITTHSSLERTIHSKVVSSIKRLKGFAVSTGVKHSHDLSRRLILSIRVLYNQLVSYDKKIRHVSVEFLKQHKVQSAVGFRYHSHHRNHDTLYGIIQQGLIETDNRVSVSTISNQQQGITSFLKKAFASFHVESKLCWLHPSNPVFITSYCVSSFGTHPSERVKRKIIQYLSGKLWAVKERSFKRVFYSRKTFADTALSSKKFLPSKMRLKAAFRKGKSNSIHSSSARVAAEFSIVTQMKDGSEKVVKLSSHAYLISKFIKGKEKHRRKIATISKIDTHRVVRWHHLKVIGIVKEASKLIYMPQYMRHAKRRLGISETVHHTSEGIKIIVTGSEAGILINQCTVVIEPSVEMRHMSATASSVSYVDAGDQIYRIVPYSRSRKLRTSFNAYRARDLKKVNGFVRASSGIIYMPQYMRPAKRRLVASEKGHHTSRGKTVTTVVGKEKYFVGLCMVVIEAGSAMRYMSHSSFSVSFISAEDRVKGAGSHSSKPGSLRMESHISYANYVILLGTCHQPIWKLFTQKLFVKNQETKVKHEISSDPAIYVTLKVSGTLILLDGHIDRTFKAISSSSITPDQPPIDYVIEDQIERCDEWLKATASYVETVRTMLPMFTRKKHIT